MRESWEGGAYLDEPANITERDLRSLRRCARAGKLAVLLALVSACAAGWSLLMGPDALAGLEGIQNVKLKVLAAIGQPIPAETHQAQASTSRPAPTQGPVGAQATSTPATPSNRAAQDSSAAQVSVSNSR